MKIFYCGEEVGYAYIRIINRETNVVQDIDTNNLQNNTEMQDIKVISFTIKDGILYMDHYDNDANIVADLVYPPKSKRGYPLDLIDIIITHRDKGNPLIS